MWIKNGSKGKFLSGTIDIDDNNSIKVLVFPNGYKEESKHPDYVVYAVEEHDNSDAAASFTNDDIPF